MLKSQTHIRLLWLVAVAFFLLGLWNVTSGQMSAPTGYGSWGDWYCRPNDQQKTLIVRAINLNPFGEGKVVGATKYCSPTASSCLPNTRLCSAADKNICCPGNSDTGSEAWQCATEHVNVIQNLPAGKRALVQTTYFDVATCLPPLPAPADRIDCGVTSGDGKQIYCNKNTQECTTLAVGKNSIRHCQPTVCPGGQIQRGAVSAVDGTTDFVNEKRCCATGKGFNHPNGMPDCTSLPKPVATGLAIAPNDTPVAPADSGTLGRLDLDLDADLTRSTICSGANQRVGDALWNKQTPSSTDWLMLFFCSPKELAGAKYSCPVADLQKIASTEKELSNLDQWLANNPLNPLNLGLRFLAILRRWALQNDLTNLQNSCPPARAGQPVTTGIKNSTSRSQLSCFSGGTLPSQLSGLSPEILKQIMDAACNGGVRVP